MFVKYLPAISITVYINLHLVILWLDHKLILRVIVENISVSMCSGSIGSGGALHTGSCYIRRGNF